MNRPSASPPPDAIASAEAARLNAIIAERVELASKDPVPFIDHFCYTFDPKRAPYHLPFRLYPFQIKLIWDVKEAIETGHDILVEKTREMGATYVLTDVLLWFWLYVPGSNFLLGSRKEDLVDGRKSGSELSNKEESLFGKLEYTLRRLPAFMLPHGRDALGNEVNFDFAKHSNFMSIINPVNGNVISGESSNGDFSRGGRYKAILMDEFAFWEQDTTAWGSTADTTNCRIVLTTPGHRPSKAKRLRFGTDGEQIQVITLPYYLDPRKTPEWLERERGRRSEQDFAREIMINWETSITGKVYEEIRHARLGTFPYNPFWPIYLAWDFGLDGVAMQWWQTNLETGRPRLIDCYFNTDKPIQYYFPLVGAPIDSNYAYTDADLDAIVAVAPFKKPVHFGDPDVAKRSLLTGTTTSQELRKAGVYVQTRPEANDFTSRRDRTKVLLQNGIEVNDTPRTRQWYEALSNARYPQRQETSQSTTAVSKPIHDWTSHHRTATEYFATNYDVFALNRSKERVPDSKLFTKDGWY